MQCTCKNCSHAVEYIGEIGLIGVRESVLCCITTIQHSQRNESYLSMQSKQRSSAGNAR